MAPVASALALARKRRWVAHVALLCNKPDLMVRTYSMQRSSPADRSARDPPANATAGLRTVQRTRMKTAVLKLKSSRGSFSAGALTNSALDPESASLGT